MSNPDLYQQLLADVETYLQTHQVTVSSGLTIALGPVGLQHLAHNGFVPLEGARYLQTYQFMRIDAVTAKTEFWRRLLRGDSQLPAFRRFDEEQLLPR